MKKTVLFLCLCACFSLHAAFSSGSSAPASNPTSPADRLGNAQSRANEAAAGMERAFAEADSEPTLQDQYFLGRAVAASILTTYKPYTGNPALTQYLNHICQAIVINNPEIGLFDGSHVLVLDSPELNAFASPGGHIYITKGLVETASSEDMLAAIIAHELAHIKLKHGMKMIEEMRFYDDMADLANRAFEFSRDSTGARRLSEFRASVTVMVDTMLRSGYSYSQEFEADEEALSILAAAGYNPAALLDVFRVLQRVQTSQRGGFNVTHPNPAQRLERAQRYVTQYQIRDTQSYRESRFKGIME